MPLRSCQSCAHTILKMFPSFLWMCFKIWLDSMDPNLIGFQCLESFRNNGIQKRCWLEKLGEHKLICSPGMSLCDTCICIWCLLPPAPGCPGFLTGYVIWTPPYQRVPPEFFLSSETSLFLMLIPILLLPIGDRPVPLWALRDNSTDNVIHACIGMSHFQTSSESLVLLVVPGT